MKNLFLNSKLLTLVFLLLLSAGLGCKKESKSNVDANRGIVPNNFLSNSNYDQLIVEIQYVAGFQPTATAVDNLKAFLQQRLNKSAGITILQNQISSPGKSAYSLDDIKGIENTSRTQKTSGKLLTAYFLFLDADYNANSGGSKVLGIAYGATSMVIFEKTIKEFSGNLGQPSNTTLESTVLHHEFGHILGLVNNGTVLQSAHQDSNNGKHCNNQNCLMYYTAETSDIVANLLGGIIPSLDPACIDDLRGNGGK